MKNEFKKRLAEGYQFITVDLYGEPVEVLYKPNWLRDRDVTHIEFHSYLTSETGYYGHFTSQEEIEAKSGIEKYLADLAVELHHSRDPKASARRQGVLF